MINQLVCEISEDISAGCDVRTWKISSIMSLFKHNKMPAEFNELNSLTTRGPRPGPYIDHILYEGPQAGALRFEENSV